MEYLHRSSTAFSLYCGGSVSAARHRAWRGRARSPRGPSGAAPRPRAPRPGRPPARRAGPAAYAPRINNEIASHRVLSDEEKEDGQLVGKQRMRISKAQLANVTSHGKRCTKPVKSEEPARVLVHAALCFCRRPRSPHAAGRGSAGCGSLRSEARARHTLPSSSGARKLADVAVARSSSRTSRRDQLFW